MSMESPAKAKREAYTTKLRSRAAASAKSGEGGGPKSVSSSSQSPGDEHRKERGAEAKASMLSPEMCRKSLKEALEGVLGFKGDEEDVFAYAAGLRAAHDAMVVFVETWVDCPALPWPSVRTLLSSVFPASTAVGGWAREFCAPTEETRDAAAVLESFEAEFFSVSWSVKASRAWHGLALRAGEKPKAMLARMMQLEALMDSTQTLSSATEVYLKGLPVELRRGFGMAEFKSPTEVCAAATRTWEDFVEAKAKKEEKKSAKVTKEAKQTKSAASVSSAEAVRSASVPTGEVVRVRRCYLCDEVGHFKRECPKAMCAKCGKPGHMAAVCVDQKVSSSFVSHAAGQQKLPRVSASSRSGHARVAAAFGAVGGGEAKRIHICAVFGGRWMTMLVDIGAQCSIGDEAALQGCQFKRAAPAWSAIAGVGGIEPLPVLYGARAGLSVGARTVLLTLSVVRGLGEEVILGVDALEALGILGSMRRAVESLGVAIVAAAEVEGPKDDYRGESVEAIMALDLSHLDDVPEERDRLRAALVEYRGVFLAEGRLPHAAKVPPVRIRVIGDAVIVPSRPWNSETREELEKHEDLMIKEGLSFFVDSSEWRSEPLVIRRPGRKTRHVGDFRAVNGSLADEAYPMPNILQEAERILGAVMARVFSQWDMTHGFWQLPTTPDSYPMSTLRATRGLRQSKRVQQGWKPAPGVFNQRVREHLVNILPDKTRARTGQYVDDLGSGSSGETRAAAVKAEVDKVIDMLKAARESGFQFGLKKCKFVVENIEFCGLELSSDGRRLTRGRTEALLNFGSVKTKTDLRRLIGLAGQWRMEVDRLDVLLRPLYKAANVKGGKLVVTSELEANIEAVKAVCSKAVAKRAYNPSLPAVIRVDGSRDGFGASLEQEGHVVALASRQKTKSEVNYVPFDTEWCAILFGLESFEPFTSGAMIPIEVDTDCQGLESIESRVTEDKTGRRAGWCERCRRFNYKVMWVPRENQKVVDALAISPQFKAGVRAVRDELIKEEAELAAEERAANVSAAEVVVTEVMRRDDAWWRSQQLRDPKLCSIIDFKEEGRESEKGSASSLKLVAAMAANLDMQNGVLGKLIKPEKKKPLRYEWEWRVLLPDVDGLRKDFFDRCHTEEGGHMRFDQTYERLRSQVFWSGMWNDCLKWCRECLICAEFTPISGNWGPLQPRGSERLRGKRIVAVDIAGPFETTPEGYTHILVAVDETDAWVEIEPLSSMEATEVIEKFLLGEVANNGVPVEICIVFMHSNRPK